MTEEEKARYKAEFLESLPKKPYATDDLDKGLKVEPKEIAIRRKYIQLNTPSMKRFITFDLDFDTWPLVAEDKNLPNPLYFVQNKSNDRAHLIYELQSPICVSDKARTKPQNYLADIIRGYQIALHADPCYVGLISKNPFSDYWRVFRMTDERYTLKELERWVYEKMHAPKIKLTSVNDIDYSDLGRNCEIFVKVKKWAYRAIREYWDTKLYKWLEAVEFQCNMENAQYSDNGLSEQEIRYIARSISKWTWKQFTPEKFSELQRARINRRWSRESRKSKGLEMLRNGSSVAKVMKELEVSKRTVFNWKSEFNF